MFSTTLISFSWIGDNWPNRQLWGLLIKQTEKWEPWKTSRDSVGQKIIKWSVSDRIRQPNPNNKYLSNYCIQHLAYQVGRTTHKLLFYTAGEDACIKLSHSGNLINHRLLCFFSPPPPQAANETTTNQLILHLCAITRRWCVWWNNKYGSCWNKWIKS